MKTLYLVRHAKAVSRGKPGPDFARPLSPRGKNDAQKMAKYVKKKGPSPDLLISSPAKRALRTARIFATVCCYPVARIATNAAIYEQSDEADMLLNIIQTVANSHQTIMIFGHDPLFTAFASFYKHLFAGFQFGPDPEIIGCCTLRVEITDKGLCSRLGGATIPRILLLWRRFLPRTMPGILPARHITLMVAW